MTNDGPPECYVVTYGEGGCIDDVHGVFMDEERATIAAEELERVYDGVGEWATVETHELVIERGYEVSDDE